MEFIFTAVAAANVLPLGSKVAASSLLLHRSVRGACTLSVHLCEQLYVAARRLILSDVS